MTDAIIPVPVKHILPGKEVYADRADHALQVCMGKNLTPVFMPSLADARIEAPKDAPIWHQWYCAPSVRATGQPSAGKPVVVYAHIQNYFSDPANIAMAIETGLVKRAGKMPQDEFQRLVDLDGSTDAAGNRLVWVIDYAELREAPSDSISIAKVLKHPQTIPFLGGAERAERYLARHSEVYGNNIGVWHSDDLSDQPLGRLLCLGGNAGGGLDGGNDLYGSGRFVGVPSRAEGAPQNIAVPTAEQISAIVHDFVAPCNKSALEERITALFR